jgi:hypothetical protein
MQSYLDFMEELRMPPRDRKLVMSENAIRLFRLPIDAPAVGERLFGRLQDRD